MFGFGQEANFEPVVDHELEQQSAKRMRYSRTSNIESDTFRSNSSLQPRRQPKGGGENFNFKSLSREFSWSKMQFKREASDDIDEEIFQENVGVLKRAIEDSSRDRAQWTKGDSNCYYGKIDVWIRNWTQLFMREREKLYGDVSMVKDDIINKYYLNDSRLQKLTGVFDVSMATMKFSEKQKNSLGLLIHQLKDVISGICKSLQVRLHFIAKLESKDRELFEARKAADEYGEELRKVNTSLEDYRVKSHNSTLSNNRLYQEKQQAMCTECFQFKEMLNESVCKKQNEGYVQEIKETENKLKKIREELSEAVNKWKENRRELKCTEVKLKEKRRELYTLTQKCVDTTPLKQNEEKEMLSQIRAMLITKQVENIPNCQFEIENLNKNSDDIFKDIQDLMKQNINKGINCQVQTTESAMQADMCTGQVKTTESAMQTGTCTGSLTVSEYEMHLVTLIASFLTVTPFPVSANYIYSYVANIDNTVDLPFVEGLLKKFPSFFKEVVVASGSHWSYLYLKPVITI